MADKDQKKDEDSKNGVWREIIFVLPVKVLVTSPIHQLDIQRIRSKNIRVDGHELSPDTSLADAKWLVIEPQLVFAAQHADWIDFERSAISLKPLHVPVKNIAAMI